MSLLALWEVRRGKRDNNIPQQQQLKLLRNNFVLTHYSVGLIGITGFTTYAPSKFAVRGLAEVLHMELQPHNIQVTLIFVFLIVLLFC